MVKEIPITTLNRYPASEKNKYPQVVVEIMTNDGLIKGYANDGNWNKGWVAGKKIKADITMKVSQTGTKYAKLNCPPELKTFGSGNAGAGNVGSDREYKVLCEIRDILKGADGPAEEETPLTQDDIPDFLAPDKEPSEEEINIDDIPVS